MAGEPSEESATTTPRVLPCWQAEAAGRIAVNYGVADSVEQVHEGDSHDSSNDGGTEHEGLFIRDVVVADRATVAAEGRAQKPADGSCGSRGDPYADEREHSCQAFNCHQLTGIAAHDVHGMLSALAVGVGVHNDVTIGQAGDVLHELLRTRETTQEALGNALRHGVAGVLRSFHQQGSEDASNPEEGAEEGAIEEGAQVVAQAVEEAPDHVVSSEVGPKAGLVALHPEEPDLRREHDDKLRDGVEQLHDPDEDHEVVDQGDCHQGVAVVHGPARAEVHLLGDISRDVQHQEAHHAGDEEEQLHGAGDPGLHSEDWHLTDAVCSLLDAGDSGLDGLRLHHGNTGQEAPEATEGEAQAQVVPRVACGDQGEEGLGSDDLGAGGHVDVHQAKTGWADHQQNQAQPHQKGRTQGDAEEVGVGDQGSHEGRNHQLLPVEGDLQQIEERFHVGIAVEQMLHLTAWTPLASSAVLVALNFPTKSSPNF